MESGKGKFTGFLGRSIACRFQGKPDASVCVTGGGSAGRRRRRRRRRNPAPELPVVFSGYFLS